MPSILSVSDIQYELKDSDILHLSHRIISEQELRDLVTIDFKLDKHIIDNALYEEKPSIQSAANKVLNRWSNMQLEGRNQAYVKLQAALAKYQRNQLAEYLRKLVERREDAQQRE